MGLNKEAFSSSDLCSLFWGLNYLHHHLVLQRNPILLPYAKSPSPKISERIEIPHALYRCRGFYLLYRDHCYVEVTKKWIQTTPRCCRRCVSREYKRNFFFKTAWFPCSYPYLLLIALYRS